MTQQGDVRLFQTVDDGDISVVNGLFDMDGGLETAAYVSLFGGNEDDDGRKSSPFTWWGNLDEIDTAYQYRSETQNLLQSLPLISANLLRVEDAAKRDLEWFKSFNIASEVLVEASIPGINKIQIDVIIRAEGEESRFTFVENWKSTS